MSRGLLPTKLAAVDSVIDRLTGAIFAFQFLVVLVMGCAGNVRKIIQKRKVGPRRKEQAWE
jgi:phospholipid-translocating ATPase